MRSSTGKHYVALDHVRAIAAFMVVCWHFGHVAGPASLGSAPALAFLDEGHTGVALFMVLSGYLFAKLLKGSRIAMLPFLWNRILRLGPLLLLVLTAHGIIHTLSGGDPFLYISRTVAGFLFPTMLQKGTWSIAVEFHFYIVLPLLLWILRNRPSALLLLLIGGMIVRGAIYLLDANFQEILFRTIIGRGDQFVCGMLAYHYSRHIGVRLAALALTIFLVGYGLFDLAGGYYNLPENWQAVWIFLPSFEGICFATIIAWYDRNPIRSPMISDYLQRAGDYSYSIYLLHFFFFSVTATAVNEHIMDISNFYLALPWIVIFFAGMTCVGHLSYKFIEEPFLRFRKPYLRQGKTRPGNLENQTNAEVSGTLNTIS